MSYILYPISTLSFAYPWLLLLPFVGLAAFFLKPGKSAAAPYPSLQLASGLPISLRQRLRFPVLLLLGSLTIIALSLAAARPQRISGNISNAHSRNIVLALDISKSMSAQDFDAGTSRVNRLEAVKSVVAEFIAARPNDRLALVVFGSNAYVQCPLTLDHALLSDFVRRLDVGLAGDGTAIGDGLGLSLKRIQDLPGESKAVILLTDGVSNSGQVNPIKAAKVAAELGIKVHTIGIGSHEPLILRMPGGFFSQSITREPEFDEATLKEIAQLTGGVYFNAQSVAGLQEVYAQIDKLEQTESEESRGSLVEELFWLYALGAWICLLLFLASKEYVFLKVP